MILHKYRNINVEIIVKREIDAFFAANETPPVFGPGKHNI